ncbi:Mobile element protein [Richelia intracellularis]|nr:Mobile element protein [Richelia intracellularis]
MSEKDTDAPWTKKNGQSSFGYKNHIDTDVEYVFIRRYQLTDASVHDCQMLGALLDDQKQGEEVWADTGYGSESIEWILQILQFLSHIHERAYGNHPLTAKHKEDNPERSQVRPKVEHVFGHWVNEMGGKLMGSIGKQSVKATIGVKNLVYNFKRYGFWENKNPKAVG